MSRSWPLFYEARFIVLLLAVTIGTTSGFVCYPSEPHVRWSGTFLLALGLLLVYTQLKSIAHEFNHPSPLQGFYNWLKRLRLAINPPAPVTIQAVGTSLTTATASAVAVVTRANPDLATLLSDLRREFEERKMVEDARHQSLVERIDKEGAAHVARTAVLESAQGTLSYRVEGLAVGDIFTAFIGLFLTLIGTIETGLAQDIARLLGGHG